MLDFQDARKVAQKIAAVGDATRMFILYRLAEGPKYVGQLATALDIPMVNTSHHLGVLRQAGLIEDKKDGRRVVYSLKAGLFTAGGEAEALGVFDFGGVKLVLMRAMAGPARDDGAAKPAARKPRKGPAV